MLTYIQGSIKSYKILSTCDFVWLQLVKVWACPTSTDISTYKLKNRYKCRYLIEFVDIFIFSSLRHKREHKRARHSVNSIQTVSSTVSISCSCVAEWVQNALKRSRIWWFAWFFCWNNWNLTKIYSNNGMANHTWNVWVPCVKTRSPKTRNGGRSLVVPRWKRLTPKHFPMSKTCRNLLLFENET